jgi:myosin heavy subunit
MGVIGLQQHEQDEIFKTLSIILWLGNVIFVENDGGNAAISDPEGIMSWFRMTILKTNAFNTSRQLYCLFNGSRW